MVYSFMGRGRLSDNVLSVSWGGCRAEDYETEETLAELAAWNAAHSPRTFTAMEVRQHFSCAA